MIAPLRTIVFTPRRGGEPKEMEPEKIRRVPFKRVYLYMLAFGFLLFGVFALYFRSYNHPIYGHIDLGEYHQYIGLVSIALFVACMMYLRKKK